ncbi:DNA-directed RNA polymerase subunit omega [Orenia metallireducens]|uniref:DNA-directed RNA polymerase subunit omega n=1 Tax=Orenia metallireducens TaxID=1413210 RepID=A0A1C0AC57_9FIRM|nr:DNA-directed RNA polymerase subunit omega [Orenia metallireducens]OCL27954.1 DNA-directed RNA polymerase subunit omega [Orenia metallireducens]
MLSYPGMNELVEKCGSAFSAVIISAKRARKMNEGAEGLLDNYKGTKDVSKALEEIVAGKLRPVTKR